MDSRDQDKNEDCEWLSLEEAWKRFFQQRERRPNQSEFEKVVDICNDLGVSRFCIRADNEIIFSEGHIVHINPGFVAAKKSARHLPADRTYSSHPYRLRFSTFAYPPDVERAKLTVEDVLCPKGCGERIKVTATCRCGWSPRAESAEFD